MIGDVVLAYERDLVAGRAESLDAYLLRVPAALRTELWIELSACRLSQSPWQADSLSRHLHELLLHGHDRRHVARAIEIVYLNRFSAGDVITWDDVATLGFGPSELRLRVGDEPYGLGDRLAGRYELTRRIGNGSFGVVFVARDLITNHAVAIKTPRDPELAPELQAILRREMEVANATDHPGVVRVFEHFTDDAGLPVLAMRLVDGVCLQSMMNRRLRPRQAAEIAVGILDALAAVHDKGFFVRDLSPGNVLVSHAGDVFIADLGLSLSRRERESREGESACTPRYAAPETLRGGTNEIDGRADVWAVGAMLHEMLAGSPVVSGADGGECFAELMMRGGCPPLPSDVDTALREICRRSTQLQVDLRTRSARAFAAELRNYLNDVGPPAAATAGAECRWRAWRIGWLLGTVGRWIGQSTTAVASLGRQARAGALDKAMLRRDSAAEQSAELALMSLYEVAPEWGFNLPREYDTPGLVEQGVWPFMLSHDSAERCLAYLAACAIQTGHRTADAGKTIDEFFQSRASGERSLYRLALRCALKGRDRARCEFETLARAAAIPEALYHPVLASLDANAAEGEFHRALVDFRYEVEERLRRELQNG